MLEWGGELKQNGTNKIEKKIGIVNPPPTRLCADNLGNASQVINQPQGNPHLFFKTVGYHSWAIRNTFKVESILNPDTQGLNIE